MLTDWAAFALDEEVEEEVVVGTIHVLDVVGTDDVVRVEGEGTVVSGYVDDVEAEIVGHHRAFV